MCICLDYSKCKALTILFSYESYKQIRIGNRSKSTCIMHSQRWALISSTSHLSISSTLTEGRNLTCKSHWVSLDHLPIPSKAAKISRTVNLRHFVICVSAKNCSYSRQKRHKLFSSQEGDGETVPDAEDPILSGLADEEVDKLLKSEENQALLKDLGSAMQRVDSARKELDDIEEREKGAAELRAYIQRLEGADSVIAESLREVSEAEARVRKAELALVTARAGGSIRDLSNKWEEVDIDENAERIESIKASSVSALIGTLASIPIALVQANSIEGLLIKEAIIFISCALFGVTYRYTVRQNLDNIKLKSGAVAAFGLVRGLSQFDAQLPVDFDVNIILSHALDTGLMLGESMFVFIAAAIGLDYCMKVDLLKPFPSKKGMLM